MGFYISVIFIALVASLIFSIIKKGKFAGWSKIFRIFVVIASVVFFVYYFVVKSLTPLLEDAVAVQIINKLPQPLDFYIIKVEKTKQNSRILIIKHLGNIRSEYFRLDYLMMQDSDEFWVVGFLGKKNMVYFSQHYLPNKNLDQQIEVRNYVNQSFKLSNEAKRQVENYQYQNIKFSVWVTLDLLLLFLNTVLLIRGNKNSKLLIL